MELDAYAAVVLKRRPGGASGPRDDVAFETIGRWQPGADEGRKFFYLTGDFNPIHTWPALARRTRFRGCIMHGFGGFAQAFEAIRNAGHDIADIDVKFVRPLPLPGPEVLIQIAATADASGRRALRLADASGNVYHAGSFLAPGTKQP
jgi:acyl dehydratase